MKNKKHFLLKGISDIALSAVGLSLSQCCHGAIYQPSVDTDLRERAFRLTEEKRRERRQAGGGIL